jgi:hypothetical protein
MIGGNFTGEVEERRSSRIPAARRVTSADVEHNHDD